MTRATPVRTDPWRALVNVAQIPEGGLHREIEADQAARKSIAEMAGLRDVVSARASFDLTPRSGGRVQVAGHLTARVGQTCVVTLDPIENDIDEAIDLIFAPIEQLPQIADQVVDEEIRIGGGDVPDPPEPIENGAIDLGRLATDVLFLAIDPYPRKEGAEFKTEAAAADPKDHPFAALKGFQAEAGKPKSGGDADD